MIAACPNCDAKYRVDEAKVGADGARLRCARCEAVFRVRGPAAAAPESVEAPAAARPKPKAQVAPPEPQAPPQSEPEPSYDRERLVLVADPDDDAGKQAVGTLSGWGIQTILVQDGVEAMLAIQRHRPRLVILDAALPKMYGFQVCEVVKRNESLRDTIVVLVGAIHNSERYRRPPSDLYGADVYLEQPDLPDGLATVFARFGIPMSGSLAPPAAPAPAPVASAQASEPTVSAAAPAAAPAAAAPAADVSPELAAEREKADRLARIVVSDIVLYQGEKFDAAIAAGNLMEAMDSEIEEGRSFFRQRISEEVRSERDHLADELRRVAGERTVQ
jgi:predicted Zn finger-like uncharacterized protein